MRRLALLAALACLVTLAPTAVLATGLGLGDALGDACPQGPAQVASHTDIQPTVDGQAVSVDFALEEGCDAVDVSLLSYRLVPGATPLHSPEQVLYDVATTTAPAGRVNRLAVAVVPDCWSLVKLVVGRPPAGETDQARIRAWDRRNTVHSTWRDGQRTCSGAAPSPLEQDGILGPLLQGPGAPATSEAPASAGAAPEASGRATAGARGSGAAGQDRAAAGGAGGQATATTSDPTAAARSPGDAEDTDGADPAGTGGTPQGVAAAPSSGGAGGAAHPAVIAADGALPLTGTNALSILIAGIGLVVVGTVLLRSGRRYRARHLASS